MPSVGDNLTAQDSCTIPMHGHSGYYDSMWLHDSGPIKGTPWFYDTMMVFKFESIKFPFLSEIH